MYNDTQANPQWFSQHQETARKSRQNPDLNCCMCFFSERFKILKFSFLTSQQNKCFNIYSSGKYRHAIKWTTANEKKVTDYILFGLAGLLLVFLIIGTLWETWSRRQKKQISRGVVALFLAYIAMETG